LHARAHVYRKGAFKLLATGSFVMGANQIVVRNSQGPLRGAERREELTDGEMGGGAFPMMT